MNIKIAVKTFENVIIKAVWLVLLMHVLPAWADGLSGFDCLIQPTSVVKVGTDEKGVLDKLMVDRGDHIRKGEVLAKLESESEEVAVELARAQAKKHAALEAKQESVKFDQHQLDRISGLVAKKALPEQEKDKAENQLKIDQANVQVEEENLHIAKVDLKRAEVALDERTIYSPINGVVMKQLLQPGELVQEQKPIIKIAQIVPLKVNVIVPVEHFGQIKLGMRAEVTPKIPGVGSRIATVVAVDPVVDAASNTFGVELKLPNKDESVPGGIRCDIRFISNDKQAPKK